MPITMNELSPIALCVATADMFDTRRYLLNFADNLTLRIRDRGLERELIPLKRELGTLSAQRKFIDGYKIVLINNIDRILAMVENRYLNINLKSVQGIIESGKILVSKILISESFESIENLSSTFRNKIMLPTHSLFVESMKRSGVAVL